MKTLEQWTPAAINDEATRLHRLYGADGGLKEYRVWIATLRRECFERRAATMDPDGALADWEGQMIAKHGPKVQLHGITYSWKAGLAVARFGEDPTAIHPEGHYKAGDNAWPQAFDGDDVVRAKRWLYEDKKPDGATYITREG